MNMNIEKTVFEVAPDIISRTSSDGSVSIIKLENLEDYFLLNKHAADLFNYIDGKKTVEALVEKIYKSAKLKKEIVREGVLKTISDLSKQKVIRQIKK